MKSVQVCALGYFYQGDYSIPLDAARELRNHNINVMDISLGAIKAASFLQIISPNSLLILTSEKRGNKELRIYRPTIDRDSVMGWTDITMGMRGYFMDIDSFISAAGSLGALPEDTTVFECEAEKTEGIGLSEWGRHCLQEMVDRVLSFIESPQ
ncbi:hypothetical protein CM19_10925 [Candidatus Acidianus copahuensis]|uniref:Ni,Fe-hydrogenase maturation factor n=1 Tax=Candidatus Acidianus copahuensis TaxID=1160895 RepID=A0A031LIM2_9CREN|nr:hypothetical protein [Candidatus Acidianus copahuensis]EZQ01987.1 hypothetical protein CM19_10925 [Candidatus Acidianus copahuensis]